MKKTNYFLILLLTCFANFTSIAQTPCGLAVSSTPTVLCAGQSATLSAVVTSTQIITYTATGTTTWIAPAGVTSVQVLVVAGGGSGGNHNTTNANGGGGGGGLIFTSYSITPGNTYTVIVGAGGPRVPNATCG